ncbi:MmcQ/YjbR family DNA-binding protein [Glaciecola sp. XM2]|uniref:MmcQ/YjbR family DNA-binding protein n=1 Tax=Glaciecola sp. XM2 TaxID=1914931 RepID=UPI00331E6E56
MQKSAIIREQVLAYLAAKPGAQESFPFDTTTSVLKVGNKMFALLGYHNDSVMLNLKCPPDEVSWLCDTYSYITPGYHMNKKHWISIYFEWPDSPPDEYSLVHDLIDKSYHLIVSKLARATKEQVLKLQST